MATSPLLEPHCCDRALCAGTDSSLVDRLLLAACVAAQTCRSLTPTDLRTCATKLFDVPPECELASAFVMAYQVERRQLAKRRAMTA
jgi:hypothetical protein